MRGTKTTKRAAVSTRLVMLTAMSARVESAPTRRHELPPSTVASVLLRSLEPPRIDHPRSPAEEALGAAVAICVDAIAALSFALPMTLHRMFGGVGVPHGLAPSQASAGDVP